MSNISTDTVKEYFNTGDKPNESQYADLIDTLSQALYDNGRAYKVGEEVTINNSGFKKYLCNTDTVAGESPITTPAKWDLAGGGVSDHTLLSSLTWSSSGHTGTNNYLAGFNGSGDPINVDPSTIGGGISQFDATIGIGGDYPILNDAITASKFNLLAVGNVTTNADLVLSNPVFIDLSGYTLDTTSYNISNSTNLLTITSLNDIASIDFSFSVANKFLFNSGEILISNCNITNGSTIAGAAIAFGGTFTNCTLNASNHNYGALGNTINGNTSILRDCAINGGGSGSQFVIYSGTTNDSIARDCTIGGTFVNNGRSLFQSAGGKFVNVQYVSATTTRCVIHQGENFTDPSNRVAMEIGGSLKSSLKDCSMNTLKVFNRCLVDNCTINAGGELSGDAAGRYIVVRKSKFSGGMTLTSTGVGIYIEDNWFVSTLDIDVSSARFVNNRIDGAVTLALNSSNNRFSKNVFGSTFTDNSTLTTNSFIQNQGVNDYLVNEITIDDLAGTGSRAVQVDLNGKLNAPTPLVSGKLTDPTTITNITNTGNWTGVNYTGPAITGTFEGQYYDDGTYYFYAYSDDDWRRLARA